MGRRGVSSLFWRDGCRKFSPLKMSDPPPPLIELGPLLFSKALTRTDIEHRFAYPVAHLPHLFNQQNGPEFENPMSFEVVDRYGSTWTLDLRVRLDGRGNAKPELFGPGWRRMLKDKKLAVEDRLNVHLNHNPGSPALFVVTVSKVAGRIRVFGQDITAYAHED